MRTEKVLVRMDAKNPSLAARYNGPYTVLERNDKSFILQLEERTDSVSIDRLVPFYSSQKVTGVACRVTESTIKSTYL